MGPDPGLSPALSGAAGSGVRRGDLAVAAAALLLILSWDLAGADLVVTRWFGDPHGFAWRGHPLTRSVLHDGGRALSWALLAVLVVNVFRPLIEGPGQAERVRCVLAAAACALVVPLFKHFSHSSCPWDLLEFGGVAAYVPHWLPGVRDGGPGQCFPSGHAVSAFAFFSGYFTLRPHRRRAARWWLAAVLAAGALFGWAQLARGAHYVSHTLWSAWLSWIVCALLATPAWTRLRLPAATAWPR